MKYEKQKKQKLTISGNPKRSIGNINLAKIHNKDTVVIEKKSSRFGNRSSFKKPVFNKNENSRKSNHTRPKAF